MTSIIERSFRPVLLVLRFAGFYSSSKKKESNLRNIWGYFTFICLVHISTSAALDLVNKKYRDSIELNRTVIVLIVPGYGSFKALTLLVNKKKIKQCIDYFGQERFAPKNAAERKILDKCVHICYRNVVLYWSAELLELLIWSVYSFFGRDGSLPVNFWLPYDYKSNPIICYSTFLMVTAGFFYVSIISQGIEPLVGGLVYQATCQIRILKYNLQHLHKSGNVLEMLKRCIVHHNDILNFFEVFENSFSFFIFCQMAGTTLGLCYSLIGLITNSSGSKMYFAACIGGYLALSFQIFFYCCFGTLLSEEYEELIVAIYLSRWYQYDIKNKKLLLTIMECSQRRLTLNAGKIVDLNFATFTLVLKTGYSLVAVLNSSH